MSGVQELAAVECRHFQQRLQAGIHRMPQLLQTQFGENPILAHQRNGVRDRGDGHHLEK